MTTPNRESYVPRPYQRLGTQFALDNQRCNIWAKPGMGKTGIVLSLLDIMKLAGSNFFPALVIGPKRVADMVWTDEAAKWDAFEGVQIRRVLGPADERSAALRHPDIADLYTINYENVLWLREKLGDSWPFKTVICDEARRLAGFRLRDSTLRADALADIAQRVGRWINLTGTPVAKDYADLWGQNYFIDLGSRLGRSFTKFDERWFRVDPYTRKRTPLPGAEAEINAALADVSIAFRPEDWFPIQEPLRRSVYVTLPADARARYNEMAKKLFTEVGGTGIEAATRAVQSGKLLQLASGSIYPVPKSSALDVHDAKNEALESIVDELDEPVLVTYHFAFTPARIKRLYPKARVLQTESDVKDWNAGKIPVMLLHYQSAGHGLNLQHGGRAMVAYDHTWDEELRQQVIERIGPTRQLQSGYNRSVLLYDIIAKDTEDEAVLIRSTEKCSMAEAFMRAHARL